MGAGEAKSAFVCLSGYRIGVWLQHDQGECGGIGPSRMVSELSPEVGFRNLEIPASLTVQIGIFQIFVNIMSEPQRAVLRGPHPASHA